MSGKDMMEKKREILQQALVAYCTAMQVGYLGQQKPVDVKVEVSEGPCYKKITVVLGNGHTVVDEWNTNPDSQNTRGTTIVSCLNDDKVMRPVWGMSHKGSYRDEVIPFLKEALAANCQPEKFNGRGPAIYKAKGLIYVNFAEGKFDYKGEGQEKIFVDDVDYVCCGGHTYEYGPLI